MAILTRPSTGQTIAAAHVDQFFDLYKGNQIFDLVNTYGCDPTGAVECSVAVNQALTDAAVAINTNAANGKGALIVGYGTLLVNQKITVSTDNIMLMGLGGGDVDHWANGLRFKKASSFTGSYILDFYGNGTQPLGGCRIKNITIDGNANSGTNVTGLRFSSFNGTVEDVQIGYCSGNGIEVVGEGTWNTYNTCLNRVWIEQCSGIGFYINSPATDGHMTDCFSYYNGLNGLRTAQLNAAADGMKLTASGWQIYGFHAYSNGGHGLNVGPVSAGQCSGGYLENNFQAGVFFDNAGGAGAAGFRFINNFVWANGRQTTNTWDNVQVGTTTAGAGGGGVQVIVTGNRIDAGANPNLPRYGINFDSSTSQNCIAADNFVSSGYGAKAIRSNGNITPGLACFIHDNQGHNPVGSVTAPSIPATTVPTVPNAQYPSNEAYTVYMHGGASTNVTAIAIAGTATGLVLGANGHVTFRVLPGQTVTLTYGAGAGPTSWNWFAD